MTNLIRKNPTTMPAPVGHYSHVTVVPKNAQLVTFSGQIGSDLTGNIPASFQEQVRNTFKNIQRALASENLDSSHVIKVNVWAVTEIDWDFFYANWLVFFPQESPSMTIAYVQALGLPEIQLEIEIWAAKPT